MLKIVFFLLFLPLSLSAEVCYFLPPIGWKCALAKNMSPHVKIGFVSPQISEFRPSINLALEIVDVSLSEYLKAVKKIHLSEPNTQWRDLGKFIFKAGAGRLTEISTRHPWGEVKMLQAIYIQDNTAYILTGASLKKDYIQQQKVLLESLQSLQVVSDLYKALPEERERVQFEQFFTAIKNLPKEQKSESWKRDKWEHLQEMIEKKCSNMGSYWQFLALQEGHERIYTIENSIN